MTRGVLTGVGMNVRSWPPRTRTIPERTRPGIVRLRRGPAEADPIGQTVRTFLAATAARAARTTMSSSFFMATILGGSAGRCAPDGPASTDQTASRSRAPVSDEG